MERESATQTCPKCHQTFSVLADEEGQHPCWRCGYDPSRDEETDEDTDEWDQ